MQPLSCTKVGIFAPAVGLKEKESHVRSPCQPSKNVLDIGVVAPGLGDSDAKLRVAQGPNGRDDACDDPDHQCHAHRAGVLQDTLRTDEDTWTDDVTCGIKAEVAVKLNMLFHCTFVCFFYDFRDLKVLDCLKALLAILILC